MATQYTSILKLALPVTGELSGTWGDVVNNNITSMIEQAIAGLSTINTWTANAHTLTVADGTTSESRCAMLVAATGAGGTALTAAGEIICPAASKLYVLKNGSSYAITLKTAAGTGVAVPAGDTAFLFCDGTNVNACVTTIVNGHISGNLTVDGNTTLGDANTDTVTVTAQFASDLLPSTDNARDLGSTAKSWRTLYCDTSVLTPLVTATNLQVTNIKANDSTAAITIADSTGAVGISTAVTMSATTQNIALGTSQTTGTWTAGGASQTGALTLDQSTKTHTLNLGTGATESGLTKTINLGTGGVSTSTTAINIGSANGTTTTVSGAFVANGGAVFNENGADVDFRVEGDTNANLLFVDASADLVGIGTNGPSGKLGVLVADGYSTLANTFGVETVNANGFHIGTHLDGDGIGADLVSRGYASTLGDFRLIAANGSYNSFSERLRITGTGQVNIGGNFTSTNNTLQVTGNAAIGYTTAAPTTGLIVAGNVGIGTDAPTFKLEVGVTNTTAYSSTAYSFEPVLLTNLGAGGVSGLLLQAVSTGTANTAQATISAFAESASSKNTALAFGTRRNSDGAVVEGMRLNSSGNLGLGTNNPAYRLDVSGQARALEGGTGSGDGGLISATAAQNGNAGVLFQTNSASRWNLTTQGTNGANLRFYNYALASTVATFDSSGNLGLGVAPSAWGTSSQKAIEVILGALSYRGAGNTESTVTHGAYYDGTNWKYAATSVGAARYQMIGANAGSSHTWSVSAGGTKDNTISFTQAMTLDASGRLLVGTTTSGSFKLDVQDTGNTLARIGGSGIGQAGLTLASGGAFNPFISFLSSGSTVEASIFAVAGSGALAFGTGGLATERARITSGGYFKASNDGTYYGSTGSQHELRNTANGEWVVRAVSASATDPNGMEIRYSAATPNGTANRFLYCLDSTALRAEIRSNGGLANYSANDVNLASDLRLKNTIEPMRSYYDVFKNINWVTWLYNDQTDDLKNHGVIAQELQELAPEFVCESNAKEAPEGEAPYLGIWEQDFKMAGMSVITELIKKIEKLEAEVAALKGV